MLASTSAMAAEFSNARRRNLSVILMASGYPVGVIIGGSIASLLLASFDWRAVFLLGAALTAAVLPLAWLFLPESIEYLATRRPANALQRINTTLRRMRHATIDALPSASTRAASSSVTALFAPGLANTTVILTFAYFTHIMTFYFTLKWIPKIVVDLGFAEELAGSVLVWANVGGVMGSVLLGLLAQWYPVRRLVIVTLILGAFAVAWFGRGQANLVELSFAAAAAGFFTNAAVVGLYALFAQAFPTGIRAGGTGFVIGFGRGGSAAGPIVAGFLFVSGVSLPTVAFLMALGSLIAAASLVFLRVPQQQHRETITPEN
jgi:MFS family permease